MDILQIIILGFVQGATEFIPVSSSGHLEILSQIWGITGDNFHYFLEWINIGTLLALLIYFAKRIGKILSNIFKQKNYKLALNLLITSIPAGIIGLILGKVIEQNDFFSSIYVVCAALGFVGLIMILIDKIPHLSSLSSENELTPARALTIGLAQVFALIPGVSRSGSTIIAGRITGMNSESSAEYSFLASIPIMCGVCLKLILDSDALTYAGEHLDAIIFGNLTAFIIGLLALTFVLKYLKKPKSLQTFGKYRLILACIVAGIALILA